MQSWVTTISRALMMGLAWAAVWVPIGMVAGHRIVGELEPEHIGGPLYAGVLCGAIFSGLAGIASGRRRIRDFSFIRAAAWGALSGLLVGTLPFLLGDQKDTGRPLWILPVVVMSSMTAAGALSAAVCPQVARWLTIVGASHDAAPPAARSDG
jgi:hypothetical protein